LLWIWCVACFLATVGLFVYLPMSASLAYEHLSERPGSLTVLFGTSAAITVIVLMAGRDRAAFSGEIRRPLMVGTVAAILGFATYSTYVYALSDTLAVAEAAPQIGDEAPGFRVVDPDGRVFDLHEYRGGPVLLIFFRGQW
jgi:cytochrome oxidase Cu insertion factor (SCO1/SenC/PrrC family)